MGFGDDIRNFQRSFNARTDAHFVNVASAVHNSIQSGSEITGAPGQPVDTGTLKNSWRLDFPSPNTAEITTNVEYAPFIEDGVVSLKGRRGDAGVSSGGSRLRLKFRSQVGGPHSVKLTMAGFDRIVEDELEKLGPG